MIHHSLFRQGLALPAVLAWAGLAFAGQTRTWLQTEYSDFEKGTLKALSLRSDGRLSLAPRFEERFDSSSAYLWALAQDSKGNVYAGGGPGAKLYRLAPDGSKKTLAELDALEIHAIAIDRKDQVYAATSPDGKVYRVAANGKADVFYDPKAKYIWGLAFNAKGDLFVATGDQGEIHIVGPNGKGRVFFKTDEAHARALAFDAAGNLIVGTEPSGLILRVAPSGEGFVMYQAPKKEVTSVAVAGDGSIYAAAVGNKGGAPLPSLPPPPPPAPPAAAGGRAAVAPAPATPPPATPVAGGSEVYRIDLSGNPRRIFTRSQDIVYALALDSSGKVLVGTGNKGVIYRIESDTLYSSLISAPPTQITALLNGSEGRIFAATGNVGKVYQLGPGLEKTGSIESDVFDSNNFTQWGRLTFEAVGGPITVVTRSGNVDQPRKNWSSWSSAINSTKGDRIASPPARFLQWKATLAVDANGKSPVLEAVEVAYLPRNLEPRVERIEVTPPNYRFPAQAQLTLSTSTPQTLTLPPLGQHRASTTSSIETTPSMQYAKGFAGARWSASDDNADTLMYKVEIRGVDETAWKPLKDKVMEKNVSWDSTAFPDGEYRLRITVSDAPSNPPEAALSSSTESDVFLIDNTPPRISGLTATRNGKRLRVQWKASDALSNVVKAEYSLDGGEWTVAAPVTKLSDSPDLEYDLALDSVATGEHTIAVRVQDDYDNVAVEKTLVH